MDKKIIVVGRIYDLIPYVNKLKMVELIQKDDINEFFESKFIIGYAHGKDCESIKRLFGIDESQAIFIHIDMLSSIEKYCPIEEKKLYKLLNAKVTTIEEPIELNINNKAPIDFFQEPNVMYINEKRLTIDLLFNDVPTKYKATIDNLPTLEEFKTLAKELKQKQHMKVLGHAQNKLAQRFGFKDYNAIKPNLFNLENFLRKSRCMSSPTMLGYSDCSNLSETINDTPIKLTIGDAQNGNTSMKSFIISSELKGNTLMNIIGVVGTGKTTYLREMANTLEEHNCKYLLVDTINNFYDIRKGLYSIEDFYKQIECNIEEQNPKWVLIDHFDVFSTHSKEKTFQESSDKFISFLNKKKICLIVVSCKSAFEYKNDFEIVKIERN